MYFITTKRMLEVCFFQHTPTFIIEPKLDSSMIMKGEKLTNQAFHPCFIYNSYCWACQEQAARRLS